MPFFWSLPLGAWDEKSHFGKKAVVYRSRFLADPKFFDFEPPHLRTYTPTHLPTSHRHARSGKPRTQQGKRDPRKCNASSVTFSPGPPTHRHTCTPLAFKHAAEKQISSAHFKREFTFILTYSLFYGMDLVAPGPTFSRQGRGKVPRGSGTTCAKRACCIYLLNTNKR